MIPALSSLRDMFLGWRGLGRFWMVIAAATLAAMVILKFVGSARDVTGRDSVPNGNTGEAAPKVELDRSASGSRRTDLRPVDANRPTRHVFAAPSGKARSNPRVGVLISGIGMNEVDSIAAVKLLPHGVSLAISPYANGIEHILEAARKANDEYVLSIPMESQGYPLNDTDDHHALMTYLTPAENLQRLQWAMSRAQGYLGVTNALGELRGERLSAQADQLNSVLNEFAHRGLFFIDARPDAPPLTLAWSRSVNMVIDTGPATNADLDTRLNALSQIALEKGSALGLVSVPRPQTLERVAAWAATLTANGLALAPVSALVSPPPRNLR